MGSEREAALPIEDFGGVNLNPDSEDLQPNQMLSAENLWERQLGILETRYGSETALYKPTSVDDNGIGNIFKIYKSWGEKKRICAVKCTADVGTLVALPTGVTVSFVTNGASYWNKDNTFAAGYDAGVTLSFTHRRLMFRFVGYGTDKVYAINVASVTGYAANTKQYLNVVVDGDTFPRTTYSGFEIYATVASGSSETPATITNSSAYQEQTMWCGYVDCHEGVDQTRIFRYSPAGYDATIVAATTIGSTERSFIAKAYVTGNNGITGYLEGGKTYYVAVLPQYCLFGTGTASRMIYRQPTVDVFGGEVVPITIPGTSTGYIVLEQINPNTTAFMVAVGDTPQTLQPYGIFNDSEAGFYGGLEDSGPPTQIPGSGGGFFGINKIQRGNPGVLDLVYTAEGLATLSFRFSDFSRSDMFMCIEDDDTEVPIFVGRQHAHVNKDDQWQDVVSDFTTAPATTNPVSTYPWYYYSVNNPDQMQRMGDGARYNFVQWENYALFVNDHDPLSLSAKTRTGSPDTVEVVPSRTGHNYHICDGYVAAPVIEDYQATRLTLPNFKYIVKFDGSIVAGGGTPSIDPITGLQNTSAKINYFTRALNPFDFTIAGAADTTHQAFAVDDDGEDISGYAIYTNTTSDQGPISQLVTLKKNACWIINELPVVTDGALSRAVSRILSKKVGGYHLTAVNTPIGTLVASYDNVYLLREDGEPAPVGQCISPLLKEANMSRAVACYHDRHYKLSFSHPDYDGYNGGLHNNVELWLNVNKMIEKKGGEDWVGPMTGRGIDFVFVEDRDGDGDAYSTSRDRYAVDNYASTGRIMRADVTPLATADTLYDRTLADDAISEPVVAEIITKDFDITKQDNNWNKLIKRFYVKLRTNWTGGVAATSAYEIFVDGVTAGEETFGTDVGNNGGSFKTMPLALVRLFPTARLRGRTFRFRFNFAKRVAIGGLQINYQVERRRI